MFPPPICFDTPWYARSYAVPVPSCPERLLLVSGAHKTAIVNLPDSSSEAPFFSCGNRMRSLLPLACRSHGVGPSCLFSSFSHRPTLLHRRTLLRRPAARLSLPHFARPTPPRQPRFRPPQGPRPPRLHPLRLAPQRIRVRRPRCRSLRPSLKSSWPVSSSAFSPVTHKARVKTKC